MKTNENGIYDARTLGLPKMLILGLQHMFAMFGATILVPVLVNTYFHGEGLSIQVTLFCAGIGTLLFHLMTDSKYRHFSVLLSPFWVVSRQSQIWTRASLQT